MAEAMSHAERLAAAFRGEPTDRVPVALWRHFPGDDRRGDSLAEAHAAFWRRWRFDLLKFTPSAGYYAEDWGYRLSTGYDPYGVARGAPVITSAEAWADLPVLPPDRGFLGEQLLGLRRLRALVGREVPVVQTLFSPLAQAHKLSGGRVLDHLKTHPELVEAGLAAIAETQRAFAVASLDAGADGWFFSVQCACRDMVTWKEYLRFGKPYDLRVLRAAAEAPPALTILHIHGTGTYFRELLDYPVQALNWHDRRVGPSLREARTLTGRCLMGGVDDQGVVNSGSPEAVRAEVADAVSQLNGRSMVVAPGCVIAVGAPDENIEAAVATARGQRESG